MLLVGHFKIQMVLWYVHPTQEHQARSEERLELFIAEPRIALAEHVASAATHTIQ